MEGIVMESVWVAVGFAAFVALVWRKAGSALSAMLDARSEKIRTAEEAIKRREQQATAKIKAAEAAMISDLREKAASLAIASAAEIITSKLDDKAGMGLIDEAAAEIEKLN